MAEYAGLEIRIGGNTTKLTNALKAPTKAAAELQSRIRQITKAMQFDPTDLKNVETRIRITGDRMQSLQSKAQLAKTAMEQLGNSVVKLNGEERYVKDIASETENLSLKAKQADERFNSLTGTLAKIYKAWNKLSRDEGKNFATNNAGIEADTARELFNTTTTLETFRTRLREINKARQEGLDFKPIMTPEELATLVKFKQLDFHDMFKRGLDLDDVIEDARNLGIVLEDSAIENVRELQQSFKSAQEEKKAFDNALKFDQLGTDLQRINSETESLSQTMRKLDDSLTPTTMSDDFQAIETQIRKVDAALDNVEHDLKRTEEAMKLDPSNIELAKRYFNDLQQQAALSEEKVGLLQQEMDMLDASGASEAAKGHQDLAKWIEESAEAARIAKKELSDQLATVANLEDQTKTLKQTISSMKGDSTLAEYSNSVQEWKRRTEQLNTEMGKLEQKEQRVAEEQKKLGEAQDTFDKASKEAEEYKSKLDALEKEYKELESAAEQMFNNDEDVSRYITKMSGLSNEIDQLKVSYSGAQQHAKELNRELGHQQKNADRAQDALDKQASKVDRLRQSIKELEKTDDVKLFQNPTEEIEKAEAELKGLQSELDEAKAKANELETAYDSKRTENELAKTSQALRDVSQDADDAKATLKSVQGEMKLDSGSILNPSTLKSIGMTLSATLTPAISALGYKMADASSTVDSAYRDMRKTVSGTEEQFEHLRQAAIDFSRTHVTSADQILQIEAIGGELGIATENLETFAEVISNIDVATNLDAEGAATALGHLANILHLTESDYVGFSDALVRLGNTGASTETEIVNIAERIGSMGAIVGMSGSDILAWSSTIASTGQNVEAAGTAISKTMSFMETAVAAAGGTIDTSFEAIDAAVREGGDRLTMFASLAGMTADEFAESWETSAEDMAASLNEQLDSAKNSLQKIADVAHMSADEFAKTWESDPTEALKAFINGLNDMEAAGGSADKVLQDLGITSVRQKQAIEGLMQTVGGLDANLKMSEEAWRGSGDAAEEAAKKAEGFSGQLQIMKNMGQNALAELGEGAVPWMKMFSNVLSELSGWFSTLSVDTKKWIVALGGIAAAAGPIISVMGTFGTAKIEFSKWVDTTTSGLNLIRMAFKYGGEGSKVFNAALDGSISKMQRVGLIGMDVGATLLKGLAVSAVVAGVVAIGIALKELYDRYKDHEAATKGLSDALRNIGVASDDSVSRLSDSKRAFDELVFVAGDYESRLADLARTIEDSNRQYGTYAGQMDYYANVISDLGNKADRSQAETYRLEAAIEAVNDACGTHYGLDEYGNIIDTQTGKIVDNTNAITDNIEARKRQAMVDLYADDYAAAVKEWAEAQATVSELEDTLARQMSGEFARDDLSPEAYAAAINQTEIALENARTELSRTEEVMTTLEGKMGQAQDELNQFNKSIEDHAKAQEELAKRTKTVADDVTGNMKRMSDAADKLGKSDADFNRVADGLGKVHVYADELSNVDMSRLVSSFTDVNGSMVDVIAALEDGGVQMYTWNAALEQAPGAAEKMSSVTTAAFDAMYEIAGGDLNKTMTLISGLRTTMGEVDGQQVTFYIGDNGSIVDSQGKVYDIKNDLASIPDEVITAYYVDNAEAMQAAFEAKAEMTNLANQNPTSKISADDKASKTIDYVRGKLTNLGNMRPTPSAYLNDYASDTIYDIARELRYLDGRSATVTVYQNTVKTGSQATGGLNSRPVIPEHASGFIATSRTMTNQGWIGEAGAEAVLNWATGGAVIPLTNKRYMLPIADAIASNMPKYGGGTTYNVYLDNVRINDDEAIRNDVIDLLSDLRRRAAMSVG